MELRYHTYADMSFEDPVAIVGFPSIGLASSIATNFLARELKLELIGGLSSPDFPPYAVIENGAPLPPVKVYAGVRGVEDDGGISCKELIIVTSEMIPRPEQQYSLGVALLNWLKEKGVKTIISLEGIPAYSAENILLGVSSTADSKAILEKYDVTQFKEGLIRGLSGVMLFNAIAANMDVMTLLTTANPSLPDPRAAARLLDPLSRMLPEVKVDTEPLFKEAEEIDARIKEGNTESNEHIYG